MKLLQLQIYSSNGIFDLILPLLIWFVLLVLGIFITRAVFSIPKILKYYKMQTVLLAKIARANGVNETEISKIISVLEPESGTVFPEDLPIRKLDSKG